MQLPAYPGWYWEVIVVTINGSDEKTVSEINLLPGSQALVPQAWQPWADRVKAGDLGVGDVLPIKDSDPRLTAGFTANDENVYDLNTLHPIQWELGLGREQVLSTEGIERAIDRWYTGDNGPRSAMAKAAPANCSSCGFLTPIGGTLGQAFGICANEFGAADGQIVAMNFGCGAHSSVRAEERAPVPVVGLVVDDVSDELDSDLDFAEDQESEIKETRNLEQDTYDHNIDADLHDDNFEEDFHEAAIIDAIEAIDEE